MKQLYKYENTVAVLITLLQKLQVKVTNSTVNETLQQHPSYPSILSISDSLKKWSVDNIVSKLDAEQLSQLSFPCIVHLNAGGGSFVILTAVNDNNISYVDGNNQQHTQPMETFLKLWSGVVLLTDENKNSGEIAYKANRTKERVQDAFTLGLFLFPFFLCMLVIINVFTMNIPQHHFWGLSLTFILKAIGVVVSGLLLWHEVDKSNPILKQVCSAGKKVNCDAVLDSKAAKLFHWLSWSEIGFFYFAGGFLSLLFAGMQSVPILVIIAYINLLALPYTLFSIFYQWRVTKQWCLLCLLVQILLVAECIVSLTTGSLISLSLTCNYIALLIPAYLIPVVVWYAVKSQLFAAQQGKRDFRQLQRMKYNPDIFEALLQKQKKITVDTTGLGITIGNPHASTTIVKVCNPYCGPCAKAHETIEKLMEDNPNLRIQIIFTATNEEKDFRRLPVQHLLTIAEENDEIRTKKALADWYGAKGKDYEAFAVKYPCLLTNQSAKIEAMRQWCDEMQIAFTPTLFINGYQLPSTYIVEDLIYFLSH